MPKKRKRHIVKRLIRGAKRVEKGVEKLVKTAEKAEKKRRKIGKSVREFQERGKATQTEYMRRGGFDVLPDYPPKRKPVKRRKKKTRI